MTGDLVEAIGAEVLLVHDGPGFVAVVVRARSRRERTVLLARADDAMRGLVPDPARVDPSSSRLAWTADGTPVLVTVRVDGWLRRLRGLLPTTPGWGRIRP